MKAKVTTHLEECLMYWVEWNTLKASPARKSREESSPATGRKVNPVVAESKKVILDIRLC